MLLSQRTIVMILTSIIACSVTYLCYSNNGWESALPSAVYDMTILSSYLIPDLALKLTAVIPFFIPILKLFQTRHSGRYYYPPIAVLLLNDLFHLVWAMRARLASYLNLVSTRMYIDLCVNLICYLFRPTYERIGMVIARPSAPILTPSVLELDTYGSSESTSDSNDLGDNTSNGSNESFASAIDN